MLINKIRFKNFMSYGNAWNEVDLDKHQLVALNGKNGAGKTTILNALTFVLFGKSFNGAPKAKLINSINQKHLVVEIEFDNDNHHYKVIRGAKPNIFQIFKDDVLIDEANNVRDYQEILESQIIKMSFKTFIQTVVVGTANFVPFMELGSADRKTIVEDLLGVGILSTMSKVLKEQVAANNGLIKNAENAIALLRTQIDAERNVIELIKKNHQQNIDNIINEKNALIDNRQKTIDTLQKIQKNIEKLQPATQSNDKLEKVRYSLFDKINECKLLKGQSENMIEFINNNDNCPTCQQKITKTHRKTMLEKNEKIVNANQSKLDKFATQMATLDEKQQKVNLIIAKLSELTNHALTNQTNLNNINNRLIEIENKLAERQGDDQSKQHEQLVIELAKKAKAMLIELNDLRFKSRLFEHCNALLKDSGIKSAVVNQYLLIINKLINQYLAKMDFFLNFELDNQFNESIKIRGRDDLTYKNLSQGERRRLDMAIMFTWRKIAQLRNSCNCDNIFVDEILDSSLDGVGVDSIMSLFRSFKDSHIVVISHRESIQDLEFDQVITASKRDQYSVLEVVE